MSSEQQQEVNNQQVKENVEKSNHQDEVKAEKKILCELFRIKLIRVD